MRSPRWFNFSFKSSFRFARLILLGRPGLPGSAGRFRFRATRCRKFISLSSLIHSADSRGILIYTRFER